MQNITLLSMAPPWQISIHFDGSTLHFVCSTSTCDVIRTEKLNGFVQPGQDLGEKRPESHGAGVVFRGGQGGGEQTAMFLTRVCGTERRSSSILTSNSMLQKKKLLQSVAV